MAAQLAAREQHWPPHDATQRSRSRAPRSYLESLQTLEGRRNIFDEQLLGLDGEVGRATRRSRSSSRSSARRPRRLAISHSISPTRQQRVEALEREVSAPRRIARPAQRRVRAVRSARTAKLQESVNSLTETLGARAERIRSLESHRRAPRAKRSAERPRAIERLTRERDAASREGEPRSMHRLAHANSSLADEGSRTAWRG